MELSALEHAFLLAAAELTRRQEELEPLVSQVLGRSAFDYWIRGDGRDEASLRALHFTASKAWRFHFHGLEVDVVHVDDRRNVRIDFGPGGALAFTPGGVGAFVQATCPPWATFPDLRSALAGRVDYDPRRCVALCDALKAKGFLTECAPELVALIAQHTRFVEGRGQVLAIPPSLRPSDDTALMLCDRWILTDAAKRHLGR